MPTIFFMVLYTSKYADIKQTNENSHSKNKINATNSAKYFSVPPNNTEVTSHFAAGWCHV